MCGYILALAQSRDIVIADSFIIRDFRNMRQENEKNAAKIEKNAN